MTNLARSIDSYRFTAPLDDRRLAESTIVEEPRSPFNEHLRRVIRSRRMKRIPPGSKGIWKDVIKDLVVRLVSIVSLRTCERDRRFFRSQKLARISVFSVLYRIFSVILANFKTQEIKSGLDAMSPVTGTLGTCKL